jgi:hypothetical protein
MKIQALKRAVPGCEIRFLEEEFIAVRVGVFDFEIEKIKTKYHYQVAARYSTRTSVFILERKVFDSPEAAYQEVLNFLVSQQQTINEALGGSKDK